MQEQLIYNTKYPFLQAILGILASLLIMELIDAWSLESIGIFALLYYLFCLYPFYKISIYRNKVEVFHPFCAWSRSKELETDDIEKIIFNNVVASGPKFFKIYTASKTYVFASTISTKDQKRIIAYLKALRIEAYTIPDGTFWF